MWPRRTAPTSMSTPAVLPTSSATGEASRPKLPPVSQSGPSTLDTHKPVGGALPETMPENTVPWV